MVSQLPNPETLPTPETSTSWWLMGDYGVYVWPTYGIMLLLLAGMMVAFYRDYRHAQLGLEREKEFRENKRATKEKAS